MSVSPRALVYLLLALPAAAQSFSTITIKLSNGASHERFQILPNGDLIATAISTVRLLSDAYDVPVNVSSRLSPLPDWTIREKYDIEAKSGLPTSEAPSQIQQMVRVLLADRFNLVIRAENKTMPVYVLTVASGGPMLLKSAIAEKDCTFDAVPECHSFVGGLGHPLNARAINMDDLVHYIENWTDLPAVNRTALSGLFTVNTEGWLPMRLPPPPPNAAPDANPFAGLPTLFTVLGKLGLNLTRQEATLPVYTVEHIERPATN